MKQVYVTVHENGTTQEVSESMARLYIVWGVARYANEAEISAACDLHLSTPADGRPWTSQEIEDGEAY